MVKHNYEKAFKMMKNVPNLIPTFQNIQRYNINVKKYNLG
jgi:hypothetical protein